MPRITVYGGAGTIGGNQVLVEDARGAFFLDFGTPYALRNRYYEEYLKPRAGAGLLDVLTLGLLPPLEGLYRADLGHGQGLWPPFRERPGYRRLEMVDGVLLSHAHLDHAGYISFLREEVPVYASLMTAAILKAGQDIAPLDIEREVAYFAPREVNRDGYLATQRGQRRQRPFTFLLTQEASAGAPRHAMEPNPEALNFWGAIGGPRTELHSVPPTWLPQVTTFGGRALRHYPVDHSVLGATAYAVETPEGWVAYTGDLRFHGTQPGLMRAFVEQLAALRPLALLSEGTHTAPGEAPTTEAEVQEHCLQAVRAEQGLVIADFGPRNVERLLAFHGVAGATGRRLVITAKDAYLLQAMGHVLPQVGRLLEAASLGVYDEPRGATRPWEEALRKRFGSLYVDAQEVHAHPGEYILCFSFWDVDNLVDIRPQGGLYIYSSSEVYDEEQGFDADRLRAWLDHFGIRPLGLSRRLDGTTKWVVPQEERGYHASGHAPYDQLLAMIREIRPRYLVPVHTEQPDLFARDLKGSGIEVRLPESGVPFRVG